MSPGDMEKYASRYKEMQCQDPSHISDILLNIQEDPTKIAIFVKLAELLLIKDSDGIGHFMSCMTPQDAGKEINNFEYADRIKIFSGMFPKRRSDILNTLSDDILAEILPGLTATDRSEAVSVMKSKEQQRTLSAMSLLVKVATLAELTYVDRADCLRDMEEADRVEALKLLLEMGVDVDAEGFESVGGDPVYSPPTSPKSPLPKMLLKEEDKKASDQTASKASSERLCMPACVNCTLRGATCRKCRAAGRLG